MLDSQIVLDDGRIDSNSRMEQFAQIPNLSEIIEKPVNSRKRHRSLTGPGSKLSSRQSLNFDSDSNNNDEEENVANESSQMLAILREEKRKNIMPFPPPLSPALSSSTFKSPSRPRTTGPASRTMHKKKAGPRDVLSTSKFNKKSLGVSSKRDRRLTVEGISTEKVSSSNVRTVSGYNKDNDWIPNIQELGSNLVGTARSSRSESKKKSAKVIVTTGVFVKKENPDDGYEPMAPSYDAINDVEIIASIHTCPTCNKEFDSRGKMKAHVSKAHSDKHTVSRKALKSKASSYNCLVCLKTFPSRKELVRHKNQNCKGKSDNGPYKCKDCNAVFPKKRGLGHHIRHNCPVLKVKGIMERKSLGKDDRPSDSEEESNLARLQINKGGDDADLNKEDDQDHGDLEDTRDDHVSCKECGGKLFTQEDFERHQQQTGHTGETIRLPSNLSI